MGDVLKKIALNDVHEVLGAKMMPFAGYNMPIRYSSDIEEHLAVRQSVGIFDVSHMGEFILKGSKALDLIQKVTSNDASKLVDGQAQYSCLTNTSGGIVDDLLVYRIEAEEYLLVVNGSNIEKDWNWINNYNQMGVDMENISDKISLFAVQGPKATATLQKLTTIDLSAIKFYTFKTGEFAGCSNVIISATGYTGSGGFEIYVENKYAQKTWEKVIEAGAAYDIKPIGLGARDTLRLEMGYCLYGNDITDTTSPLEAGLGWITKFTKDFVNAENLAKQKKEGVTRRLVGFKMIDKGIPRNGYEIKDINGNIIGKVTSGTMSPSIGIGIGMGYINKPHDKTGTDIFIVIRHREMRAKVEELKIVCCLRP